jgi:hypothetical protein
MSHPGMQAVGQTADPQTDAAIRIVAWASLGALQPTGNDFAMLRLFLLALLRHTAHSGAISEMSSVPHVYVRSPRDPNLG